MRDIMQETALRDEEEIKEGVQLGSKYDSYKKNLTEYQKETDLIDEVASVLDSQNDESIKDLDDDDWVATRNLLSLHQVHKMQAKLLNSLQNTDVF